MNKTTRPDRMFSKYYLPVNIWALIILALSVMTVPPDVSGKLPLFPHIDKVVHFIIYAVFSFLLLMAFNNSGNERNRSNIRIKAIIIAFCYGALMEIFQYFLPARSFDLMDMAANGFGAVAGQMFLREK